MRLLSFLNELHRCFEHGSYLHLRNFRIGDAKTNATVSHHRIRFVQGITTFFNVFSLDAQRFCQFFLLFSLLWHKLMKWRVKQPESNWENIHCFESGFYVLLYKRETFTE